ncbi:MAG: ABC transporter permease, partial [Paludibacteraceae bacterium]|nr:ABC transporter permease [Paludibacteraceae bacterium]
MLIIMLSVGFLVGINSVAPSMYAVVDEYYAEKNLMDFRLISTVGFSDEDVAAVSRIDGVEAVMPSYFTDVLPVGESGDVVRIYALPESYADNAIINEISLREGRLPEKDNEIVIGASRFGDYGIGSEISFTSAEGGSDISETLKNTKYEIVGIVDSPMYISFERGSTNVGSGKVAAYMMIKADNFVIGRYTDIYVTVSSLDGVKPYSEQYDEIRDRFTKVLEKTGELRVQAFSENTIFSAQASIDEAKLKFQSEKEKAENEIESAQQKIDEGYRELSEKEAQGRRELSAAKQKIEDGKKELESQKAEFKKTTSAAWKELADKESELTKGEAQIKSAKAELKESLFQSVALFGITEEQYEGFYGGKDMLSTEDVEKIVLFMQMYRTSIVTQLQHLQTALKNLEAELKSAGVDPETNAEYTARAQKIASLNK